MVQSTVPKSLPMPAVRAIANAPQNVTRTVARRTFAPPAISPDRSEKSEKAQRGSGHDRHKRSGGGYDNHEQRQGCTCRKHGRRCQCGLYRTRGSDRRNSKLIARVGGQGIFRHQLLGNPPREGWIDTTLDVDRGELIKLKLRMLAQLFAFAREIGLFSIGLRTDRHILAGCHRHGACGQSRNARDQDIVLFCGCCGYANDQACGRDDAIVGTQHGSSQPADAANKVTLRVQTKTGHSTFCLSG